MQYTDFLGKPLNEGDEIIFAIGNGYGGPSMERARVTKLVALVPHPKSSTYGTCWAREDQLNKESPTRFSGVDLDDPAKRYVVQVMRIKRRHLRQEDGSYKMRAVPAKFSVPAREVVVVG